VPKEEIEMLTLLIAVDGSEYSARAVDYALRRAANCRESVRAHLLNVQAPLVGVNVKLLVSQESLNNYYREEGQSVLKPVRDRLTAAGLATEDHIGVGDPGRVIVEYAASKGCDEIIMGTHGRGALAGAVMGSVAQKVIHLSQVPVVLVK
jgi:nucleotide-binding universal stress UspA family protein